MAMTLLEKASGEYKALRERRQHLLGEEVRLREELRDLRSKPSSDDQQREVANKLRSIQEELQSMWGQHEVAKRKAQEEAAKRIRESADYRQAISGAAQGLVEALVAWQPLVDIKNKAQAERLVLSPLPSFVAMMPAEATLWLRRQIADGVLDADAFPPSLRALVEGSR